MKHIWKILICVVLLLQLGQLASTQAFLQFIGPFYTRVHGEIFSSGDYDNAAGGVSSWTAKDVSSGDEAKFSYSSPVSPLIYGLNNCSPSAAWALNSSQLGVISSGTGCAGFGFANGFLATNIIVSEISINDLASGASPFGIGKLDLMGPGSGPHPYVTAKTAAHMPTCSSSGFYGAYWVNIGIDAEVCNGTTSGFSPILYNKYSNPELDGLKLGSSGSTMNQWTDYGDISGSSGTIPANQCATAIWAITSSDVDPATTCSLAGATWATDQFLSYSGCALAGANQLVVRFCNVDPAAAHVNTFSLHVFTIK